jgi:hypothetical protein
MLKPKRVVHVADVAAEKADIEQRHPLIVAAVELGGVWTILFVPLLKGDELIGISPCTAKKSVLLPTNRSHSERWWTGRHR